MARKWHGMEIFWSDSCGDIKTADGVFIEASREKLLFHEIKEKTKKLKNSHQAVAIFNSKIIDDRILAAKLLHDGKYLGTVWGYPVSGQKMEDRVEYLVELISLVRDEIMQFGKDIAKKEEHINTFNQESENKHRHHAMIGKSCKMQEIYSLLDKISASESSIFIQGANGTGKELVARSVHHHSPRKENLFLAVNCSAFNDNLLDSELFGHIRGAFTGAVDGKKGLFEQADGGTLFLDEVGDTSLSMQVKLLRVIQEGVYLPVGASSPKKCNVRIIASTNRPIEKMMADGKFREDLYYRLNVININLPLLKDRMEDVPLLIDHFMVKKCKELGVPRKIFSKDAMGKILAYNWPGNIRELQNELERLIVLTGKEIVIPSDVLASRILKYSVLSFVKGGLELDTTGRLKDVIEELERHVIEKGLKRCFFNKSRLARELGISRANLISKVQKYGLDRKVAVAA